MYVPNDIISASKNAAMVLTFEIVGMLDSFSKQNIAAIIKPNIPTVTISVLNLLSLNHATRRKI